MPSLTLSDTRRDPFNANAVAWRHIVAGDESHVIAEFDATPGIYGITLIDKPDPARGVTIAGYTEITSGVPSVGEYIVDYGTTGRVRFNISDAGATVLPDYWGGGSISRTTPIVVGGGGGGTGINYITNGDAEANTTGWATYKDAVGPIPVDGTGGLADITWTRSTVAPLRKQASFVFSKDAANRQGQGASYDFTIDFADQGKKLAIQCDHAIISGTYEDGDLIAYIYDKTNNRLIEPAGMKIMSAIQDLPIAFVATFQASIDSTSYRLIFHVATTSALAYDMKFDSISVGPQIRYMGPPMTDPKEFGPLTIGATTTPPTKGTVVLERAVSSQIGVYEFISYEYVQSAGGSGGAGVYKFPILPGMSIDHNLASYRDDDGIIYRGHLGEGWLTTDGSTGAAVSVRAFDANHLCLMSTQGVFYEASDSAFNFGNASLRIQFNAMVPIVGRSANVAMSADADTRVCAARANGTPANASAGNPIIFPNKVFDTHGAYDETTGEFTVPFSGFVEISGSVNLSGTSPAFAVYKNGVQGDDCGNTAVTGTCELVSGPIDVKAGDVLTVRPHGAAANGFGSGGYISFKRLSGPAQIAESEKIVASAYVSANYAVNANEAVNFDSVLFDSHGMISPGASNTWKATAPVAGQYLLTGNMKCAAATPGIQLYKNGAALSYVTVLQGNVPNSFSVLVDLLAGDEISLNSVSSTTIDGSSAPYVSQLSIARFK